MVIVPHQDDEILMTAGVIRHAKKAQAPVWIVLATNGDYGCGDFSAGRTRLKETLAGLETLGVSKDRLVIMGYADTGMPEKDSFLAHLYKETDGKKRYPSMCGEETYGLEEKQEYHMEKYGTHGAYCRDTFRQDLKEIILEKLPDRIYTTAGSDMHGDHSALYRFVCEILDELRGENGYEPELYTGIVHSVAGDDFWPEKNTPLFECPEGLEEKTGLKWEDRVRIPVPEEMLFSNGESNMKYCALKKYETALEPNAYDFLMAFIKEEEIFWRMR